MKHLTLAILLLTGCWLTPAIAFGQGTPGTVRCPSSVDTVDSLFQIKDRSNTVLTIALTSGSTTVTVASTSSFPSSGSIKINDEVIYYTGTTSTAFTGLTRGAGDTIAAAHTSGATVISPILASHHNTLAEAVICAETLAMAAVPPTRTVNGHALSADITISKSDVGLGNADNTSDANKPVSTAQQTALDAKQNVLGFTPENVAHKDAANGYAGLDSSSKLAAAQVVTGTITNSRCLRVNSSGNIVVASDDCGVGVIGGTTGSTDKAVLRASGTGGATIQSSPVTVDDNGLFTTPSSVESGGTVAGNFKGFELAANGTNYQSWVVPDSITDTLRLHLPNANPNNSVLQCGPPSGGDSTCAWSSAGVGDMLLGTVQENTAVKTFVDGTFVIKGGSYGSSDESLPAVVIGSIIRNITTGRTFMGIDASPDYWGEIYVNGISGPIGVPSGGTGLATLTAHALQVGNGVSAVTQLTVPASGTILQGVASSDPAFTSTPTLGASGTLGTIAFGNATSGIATLTPPAGALGTYSVTLPNAASTLPIFGQQITFAGPTAARTVTLPDASFTAARTDAANTFTGHQTIEGVTSTGATGTGKLVFDTAPQISTIELGAASDTTIARSGAGVLTVEGVTISRTIVSGTSAMGTGAISSATCATVVTTSATGTATTDVIWWGFNGDPTGVTGYVPATAGMLTIIAYPSADNVNFKVCNNTTSSITPGAITLNWRIVR